MNRNSTEPQLSQSTFYRLELETMAEMTVTPADLENAFIERNIVPKIIKAAPKKLLKISYPNGDSVHLGNELEPYRKNEVPKVEWQAEKNTFYTLVMFNPNSRAGHREFRNWLVMNIPGSAIEKGDEVVAYLGPGIHCSIHRYIFLVFKQPNEQIGHDEPRSKKWNFTNRSETSKTSTANLIEKYNLDCPEFGNFYVAESKRRI